MVALVGIAAACDPEADLEVAPAISVSRATIETAKPLGTGPVSENVTIVNGGDGTLNGLSTTVEYSSGNGWLTTTLDRTTATRESAATLRLDANPDALGLGSYQAVVLLDADGASNGPLRIRITLTVQPRPPAKLALATQPSPQVTNGAVLGQQPVVQLLNAVDQATPVAGVTVTAMLEGGGQLNGATQVPTDASGRASFSGLVIVGSAGSKNLTFSASGLSGVTSGAILVAPGAAVAVERPRPPRNRVRPVSRSARPRGCAPSISRATR
ncbi:MAG: carboxypeptidase-like regulatory domain-containing protein [Gemmatimonadales bacterium]